MYRTEYLVVTALTSFATLFLAAFVFFKGPRKKINFIYSAWALCVGLWSFFLVLNILAPTQELAALWCHVLHIWAIILPAVYVHFVLLFLGRFEKKRALVYALYAASAILVVADFTPWFLTSAYREKFDFYISKPLLLYPIHLFFFIGSVFYVYFELVRGWIYSSGAERKKNQYFLIATVSAYSGGLSNYFINYNFLIFPMYPYGNLGVLLYVAVIGLAIIRYGLLEIEVIIKKTLVFAGISSFVFACFSIPLFLIPNVFQDVGEGHPKLWLLALTGMAVAALVGPLNQFLVNITDKYLFQKKTNYRVLLREATEYLAHVASLRSLARTIVAFFLKKARLANASVYAFTSRGNVALSLTASRPAIESSALNQIHLSHPIVDFFSHHQGPVEIAALKELNDAKGFLKPEDVEKIIALMNSLKAEAAVPCFGGKVAAKLEKKDVYLKAILFLGHQKSDEPYSEEDLDVFFTLGQESSIAFENARLYDEVVERTRMLERTNTDLSDANEKLKVTQASLIVAEKNATMVGMAKAIGHEVNNPLSTVGGRATWIYKDELRKCRETVAQNHTLLPSAVVHELEKRFFNIEDNAKRIEKSAKRIEVVVKTLTDILKDTKGEKGPLSLLVLCREAREATRFLTYDENLSGCQIVESIASNVVILGNLEQLLQVFINMIKNAYEAMLGQQERRIEIRGSIDPDNPKMARIEFADNGPGIPDDVLPKIWGQGFSTKIVKEEHIGAAGQGQGLFICKHVIESIHGGEIFVQSAPGKGTTFVIKVPLADLEG